MNLGYDCRYGEMYFFFPQSKAEKKFNSISVEENLSLIPHPESLTIQSTLTIPYSSLSV